MSVEVWVAPTSDSTAEWKVKAIWEISEDGPEGHGEWNTREPNGFDQFWHTAHLCGELATKYGVDECYLFGPFVPGEVLTDSLKHTIFRRVLDHFAVMYPHLKLYPNL